MEGDAVVFGPGGEVRVVGDNERYLRVELSRVPAPEQVYQAVVVAGDQHRHPLGRVGAGDAPGYPVCWRDRKSTRLNSSHANISYAVFCLKKKKKSQYPTLI